MFIEILFKMLLFKGGVLIYAEHCIHYIAKSIGYPLLMIGLTTLVISMSTNLNV